ncbi:hypothetical protein HaLaN_24997 [Haematococcus lacustris]|uniref:Uncharacterized protein n=1 Tax=Haematococcus lacustris TaxID=44745 RepID=A0A6A0A426_HAELA|nr:hypothetical protein HaLaN_24997 [Haematococcus lacustris]
MARLGSVLCAQQCPPAARLRRITSPSHHTQARAFLAQEGWDGLARSLYPGLCADGVNVYPGACSLHLGQLKVQEALRPAAQRGQGRRH